MLNYFLDCDFDLDFLDRNFLERDFDLLWRLNVFFVVFLPPLKLNKRLTLPKKVGTGGAAGGVLGILFSM